MSYTCAISGLPIQENETIRVILLNENPSEDRSTGRWLVRGLPIRASYSGFGRFEDHAEDSLAVELWMRRFREEIVTRGCGDCGDEFGINQNSPLWLLVEAMNQKRLLVQSWPWTLAQSKAKALWKISRERVPEGVPTIKRISKILASAGLLVNDLSAESGYTIKKKSRGSYCLHVGNVWDRGIQKTKLELAAALLSEKFACVIAADLRAHKSVGLFVMPKLETDWSAITIKEKKQLKVSLAMVREDVWQRLCAVDLGFLPHLRIHGLVSKRMEQWDHDFSWYLGELCNDPHVVDLRDDYDSRREYHSFEIGYSRETLAGIQFEVRMLAEQVVSGHTGLYPARTWVRAAAETAHVVNVLQRLQYRWRPSHFGVQSPDWELSANILADFANIAETRKHSQN